MEDYLYELEHWRVSLDESLRAENSWLALTDLVWIEKPLTGFGSLETENITLKGIAPRAGEFILDKGQVQLRLPPGSDVVVDGEHGLQFKLKPDTSGHPQRISIGPYSMMLIERSGRLGIRLWDNSRRERQSFPGRSWYPFDPAYRITASFTPYDPEKTISIPNELGEIELENSPGFLSFELQQQRHRLEALPGPEGGFFLIFKDGTSGGETYGSGRFLVTDAPEQGKVVIDFNRAYNPPCAFTAHATCPLPPGENELSVKIEAGEKKPLPFE